MFRLTSLLPVQRHRGEPGHTRQTQEVQYNVGGGKDTGGSRDTHGVTGTVLRSQIRMRIVRRLPQAASYRVHRHYPLRIPKSALSDSTPNVPERHHTSVIAYPESRAGPPLRDACDRRAPGRRQTQANRSRLTPSIWLLGQARTGAVHYIMLSSAAMHTLTRLWPAWRSPPWPSCYQTCLCTDHTPDLQLRSVHSARAAWCART